jgi:hypothetical protein
MPHDFDLAKEIEKFPADQRPPLFVISLAPYIWKILSSPFDLMRSTGPYISSKLLDFYVKIRF